MKEVRRMRRYIYIEREGKMKEVRRMRRDRERERMKEVRRMRRYIYIYRERGR